MQNVSNCLNEAMFIASESYSNSVYESRLFQVMETMCDDMSSFLSNVEMPNVSAVGA